MVLFLKLHLFGNAPIWASTFFECSCCRIHRYVAAPIFRQGYLHHIGKK